jgi:polyphosphate kinase 2
VSDEAKSNRRRIPVKVYEAELERLQSQLVEMQEWVKETGARIIVLFEGRDGAGKGSAIKRVTEYLSPRTARVAALPAPTTREKTQWYFQRYVAHLPAAGEIVLLDRSWYNRAGVEKVMGFCTDAEYELFLRQAPLFEQMLVEDGIVLIKLWFSVSPREQRERFESRANDPMRNWKLSPMDLESLDKWAEYSRAKDRMFASTDVFWARWVTIDSDDKRVSRLNAIKHILDTVPWEPQEHLPVIIPPLPEEAEREALEMQRADRGNYLYARDWAAEVAEAARRKE